MRLSLLDIVQTILSSLNSDDVNSIGDTIESMQVATIVRTTYYSIIDGKDWPHLYKLYQLEASNTILKPTHMKLPENVIDVATIKFIKYNKKKLLDTTNRYEEIKWLPPYEFLALIDSRRTDNSNIQVVIDDSDIPLNILNNVPPNYYTCFDNEHIIFDSFDKGIDDTLQESKTQVYGRAQPVWQMEDSFVPDLPVNAFSYLLAESTSVASLALKEAPDQKSEQHSVSQRRRLSQQAWAVNKGIKFPDYGRGIRRGNATQIRPK